VKGSAVVGLVLVSHSGAVAEGTAALAREMGGEDVAISTAGGLDGDAIGTDAMRVLAALEAVWSEDGVLVLMDLGSAVLSTEMALDFLDPERRVNVRLSDAPFVEGAVAAAVAAKLGRTLDEVADEARGGLAGKATHLGVEPSRPLDTAEPAPATGPELRVAVDVDLPHGLHARPAARLVQTVSGFHADVRVANETTGRGPVSGRSLNAVATLGVTRGQRIEVVARGPEAQFVVDAVAALADRSFDEEADEPIPVAASAADVAVPGEALVGIPASPGIAIGPVRCLAVPELPLPDDLPAADPAAERARLGSALAATREAIVRQRENAAARFGRARAAIFDAHLLFLEDEALLAPALEAIASGRSAPSAWALAVDGLTARWASLEDPYLRERAGDLRSVGRQVLAATLGLDPPQARLDDAGILVAQDLEPADTIGLDPQTCWGIATAHGGATSHAAILARALGIPAVVGLGDAILASPEGTVLGLDGFGGVVHVEPGEETIHALERDRETFRERERAARALASAPASTLDGVRIDVLANVGTGADVPAAVSAGCDGVGLFRTEFLFLDRNEVPDEEEQEKVYREAAEALAGRPLTIRTLDAGSDKPVPGVSQGDEANPALGLRGIRLTLARPEVFGVQLRAIARVAADHDVRVMFPMVSTVDELRAGLDALADACRSVGARVPPAGVMIEVPSAAVIASRFFDHAAFLSVGTNDLTQYVLAADRGNDAVAALADPLHPAVLRMVRSAAEGAARDLPVAVCGEVAGDPVATPLLLGLGVRELSMSAPAIPFVKEAVRRTDLGAAAELAARSISAATAAEVRALLAT